MVKVACAAWACALIGIACQGQGSAPPAAGSGSARPGDAAQTGDLAPRRDAAQSHDLAAVAPDADDDGPARPKPEEPEAIDVGKAIAELGAVPAWQVVVDRAQYLARRGQHGVAFGVIGAPIMIPGPAPDAPRDGGLPRLDAGLVPSPYVWLVDDTDGNGALAIRVALGVKQASQGERVALGGAWALDDEHRWFWKVDAVSPLPPAPQSDLKDPPAAPGHAIASGDLPAGARTISVAKDGDAVYFQLVGAAPAVDGDGWPVADELGNPVYALLNLPGERPSYGAQDLRSPDEHWQLKRGQTYWVRIGHLHKHADKPITINARTAPVRVM
jgi:hypothetical protein